MQHTAAIPHLVARHKYPALDPCYASISASSPADPVIAFVKLHINVTQCQAPKRPAGVQALIDDGWKPGDAATAGAGGAGGASKGGGEATEDMVERERKRLEVLRTRCASSFSLSFWCSACDV